MRTWRGGAVGQSLSSEDLQVHGGRAWSRSDWGQQVGAGGFRDRQAFLRLLLLLLVGKNLENTIKRLQ